MKTSRALAFLVLFALAPVFAHAQTALKWNEDQLTWTAPSACTDGSPITDCPVTGYRLETASSCTASTWTQLVTTAPNVLTYKATGLTAGLHCYRVKATSAGGDSVASNTISATAVQPLPGAPGNLTVTDVVAYEIRTNSQGSLVASRIGLVPAGALCGQDARVVSGVTYNRIDPKSVDLINWPAGLPPKDIFAKCGQG